MAFVNIIEKKGTLDEAMLVQESYAPGIKGKLKPSLRGIRETFKSLPTIVRPLRKRKVKLRQAIPGTHHKLPGNAMDEVKAIYKHAEEHNEEFNLYINGDEGELAEVEAEEAKAGPPAVASPEEGANG
jgi:hypothetical protein